MAVEHKEDKDTAGYGIVPRQDGRTCRTCVFNIGDGGCELVYGFIKNDASCWNIELRPPRTQPNGTTRAN